MQTVYLVRNGVTTILPDLEPCPVYHDSADYIKLTDGSTIEFSHWTKKTYLNGDIKLYMPKPTMHDCVNNYQTGAFYQFYDDGSVKRRIGDETLYWSSPVHCEYEVGSPIERYIRCRFCGENCEGTDYENWSFCCRSCMVDFSKD